MRRFAAALAISAGLLPLTSCSSDEPSAMPDVVGKRLDIALSDVERAGFDDEVEVLGGGTFGIVDESNWTVCSQEPAQGTELSSAPRISVERFCDESDDLAPEGEADDGTETGVDNDEGEESVQAATAKPRKPKRRHTVNPSVADTFVMPATVGMNLQDAQDLLQSRGSFVLTQTDGTGWGRFQVIDSAWKVCGQRPAAGVSTDIATMVELITVKLDEAC